MIGSLKNIADCPDCGAEVRFRKNPFKGQIVTCRFCKSELEVVRRSPIELDWAENSWEEAGVFDENEPGS